MTKSTKKPARPLSATSKPKARQAAKKARLSAASEPVIRPPLPVALGASPAVLDRLWDVVMSRKGGDTAVSHSARLLARGTAKVAQKFGEEAVECLIEAVAGDREALVAESADVLYHLIVMWASVGIEPANVWTELQRREGVSGVTEKASRSRKLSSATGMTTAKIP